MQSVNIADLKNNLSAYLEQVKNGEELIIKDRNRPVARLMPLTSLMMRLEMRANSSYGSRTQSAVIPS